MALRFGAYAVPEPVDTRPRAASINSVESIPKSTGLTMHIPVAAEEPPQASSSLTLRFDAPAFVPIFAPKPQPPPVHPWKNQQQNLVAQPPPAAVPPPPIAEPSPPKSSTVTAPAEPVEVAALHPPAAETPKAFSWAKMASDRITPQQQQQQQQQQRKSNGSKESSVPLVGGQLVEVVVGDSWNTPAARGIVNQRNDCFMNSVMQAVVSCNPIANVLATSTPPAPSGTGQPSLLAAAQAFVWAYAANPHKKALESQAIQPLLAAFRPQTSGPSAQEDAQEFFSFVLNQVHEDLSAAAPTANEQQEDGDGWYEVGPKNQSSVMRQQRGQEQESALSQVASGVLRSALKSSGLSSASRERLFMLPLDVSPSVSSIEEAVDHLMLPELIDGVQRSSGGESSIGKKDTELDRLPQVLMVHLKRFIFTGQGAQKVSKHISFGEQFEFESKHLSRALQLADSGRSPKYQLQAVISHHGAKMSGGHYTCAARRGSNWHHFDDRTVTPIALKDVLASQAYMLVYVQN